MGYFDPAFVGEWDRTPETPYPLSEKEVSGHRYFSPEMGRWGSRDPLDEQGGVNLFAFALNDCVDNVDLLGNIAFPSHKGGGKSSDPFTPPGHWKNQTKIPVSMLSKALCVLRALGFDNGFYAKTLLELENLINYGHVYQGKGIGEGEAGWISGDWIIIDSSNVPTDSKCSGMANFTAYLMHEAHHVARHGGSVMDNPWTRNSTWKLQDSVNDAASKMAGTVAGSYKCCNTRTGAKSTYSVSKLDEALNKCGCDTSSCPEGTVKM